MRLMDRLKKVQRTKTGELVLFAASLGLTDLFFSLALNDGDLWLYLLALTFFIYGLKNFFRLLGDIYHAIKR